MTVHLTEILQLMAVQSILATIAITGSIGYSIAGAGAALGGLIPMFTSIGVSASLGTILGAIYTSEYQNPTLFWAGVLKGVSNGLKVASFGGAAYTIPHGIPTKAMAAGFSHLVSKTVSKGVAFTQSYINNCVKQSRIVYFT